MTHPAKSSSIYARETANGASIAGVLTFDEARRIAVSVAKLPELLEPRKMQSILKVVMAAHD